MEVRSSEEAQKNMIDFMDQYMDLLIQKKEIDIKIKEMKQAHKENGVAVGIGVKAVNYLKKVSKLSQAELFEMEVVQTWAEENKGITDKVSTYNAMK